MAAYAHRADLPAEHWRELMLGARRQIDLLGYALLYLPEANPRMTDLLRNKAAHGCPIRVALVNPDSPEAVQCDAEERLGGGLLARIRTSLFYFSGLRDCDGADVRLHRTPMYATVLRFDDEMIVTPHLYGRPGGQLLDRADESLEVGFFAPQEIDAMPMHPSIRLRIAHHLEHRPEPVIA